MKARYLLIAVCIFFLSGFSACYNSYRINDGDVSISIKESEDEYRMSASFDEDKTRMVQNYIRDYTGENGLFTSGGNVIMDATTTYDDDITIDLKFRPGRLKIALDKDQNSEEACQQVKEMCEGIKELLADNK